MRTIILFASKILLCKLDRFIDTNLFIYQLAAQDESKAAVANQIIRTGVDCGMQHFIQRRYATRAANRGIDLKESVQIAT